MYVHLPSEPELRIVHGNGLKGTDVGGLEYPKWLHAGHNSHHNQRSKLLRVKPVELKIAAVAADTITLHPHQSCSTATRPP
jgi:hypothetical protein